MILTTRLVKLVDYDGNETIIKTNAKREDIEKAIQFISDVRMCELAYESDFEILERYLHEKELYNVEISEIETFKW